MEIDKTLIDWLIYHNALVASELQNCTNQDKIVIIPTVSQQLLNGVRVATLLQSFAKKDPSIETKLNFIAELPNLQDKDTIYANWKSIMAYSNQLGLENDNMLYEQILQSNVEALESYLHSLKRIDPTYPTGDMGSNKLTIDLNNFDITKPINESKNSLELLILTLSQVFDFNAKQAASYFTENSRHLARVVLKGHKGSYTCIINWYKMLSENSSKMCAHLSKETNEQRLLIFTCLRYGFYCKIADVVQWCIKLFIKLSMESSLTTDMYSWFISKDGGVDAILYAMAKHEVYESYCLLLLFNVTSSNMDNILFNVIASKHKVQKNYLNFLYNIVSVIITTPQLKAKAAKDSILFAIAKRLIASSFNDWEASYVRLKILVDIWCSIMDEIEQSQELPSTILSMIRKMCKDRRYSVALIGYAMLFKLFESFAENLKPYAPAIYKTITMLIIEENARREIKLDLLSNLFSEFHQFYSIPINIFMDPYLRQISMQEESSLSSEDLATFSLLASHPKFNEKHSTVMLSILSKAIYKNQTGSIPASTIYEEMLAKFIKEEDNLDTTIKFVKLLLNTYTDFIIAKNPPKKANHKRAQTPKKVQTNSDAEENLKAQSMLYIGLAVFINKLLVENGDYSLKEYIRQCKDRLDKIEDKYIEYIFTLYPPDPTPEEPEPEPEPEQEQPNTLTQIPDSIIEQNLVLINPDKEEEKLSSKRQNALQLAIYKPVEEKVKRGIDNARQKLEKRRIKEEQLKQISSLKEKLTLQAMKKQKIITGNNPLSILYTGSQTERDGQKASTAKYEYNYICIEEEEERECAAIQIFLKKNSKALKFLFEHYASTSFSEKITNFDEMNQRSRIMILAELSKFLKENGGESINKDEIYTIVKAIKQANSSNITDKSITYEEFKQFFIQSSIYMAQKENTGSMPYAHSLEVFYDKVVSAFSERNQSLAKYNAPEASSFGDIVVLKELNKKILIEPNIELPNGYCKVIIKNVAYKHDIPPCAVLSEPLLISTYLLDELIFSQFQVHIIESRAIIGSDVKVVPKIIKADNTNIKSKFMEGLDKKKEYKEIWKGKPEEEQKEKQAKHHDRIPLSGNMRILLAKAPQEDYVQYKASAYLLEGLLLAIENGVVDEEKMKRFLNPKTSNIATKEKEEQKEKIESQQIEKEKKRQERYATIKKIVTEKNEKKKEEEKEQKTKNREEHTKKIEENKKKIEDIQAKLQLKKQQKEEKKKKEEEEKTKTKEEEETKKQEQSKVRKEFLTKQKTQSVNKSHSSINLSKSHTKESKTCKLLKKCKALKSNSCNYTPKSSKKKSP